MRALILVLFATVVVTHCLAQAPHGTREFSYRSRFVYSESFLSADEACTDASTTPCYSPTEQITSLQTGDYTRFVFDIVLNGHAQAASIAGTPVSLEEVFNYVSSEESQNTYATFSSTCPAGAPCQGIVQTVVDFQLTEVRAVYPMRKKCFSTDGNDMGTNQNGQCSIPYSYLPITNLTTCESQGGPFPPDCMPEGASCLLSGSCREQVCDSAVFPLTSAQVDAMLDANAGVERDPSTGLFDAANVNCVEACCPACASEGIATGYANQVWELKPEVFVFQALSPSQLLGKGLVTITVPSSGEVRTVVLDNLDLGTVEMNAEGDFMVRVSVVGLSTELYASLPNLSSGAILIADYSATPTGYIRMSSDPAHNSYTDLPNDGRGLTPTQTNLGGEFAVAYLNNSSILGALPGRYGVSQPTLTGDLTNFTVPDSCYNGYFTSNKYIPGWQIKSDTADVPLVPTMAHMTALLNRATTQFLSGTVAPEDIEGTWFMFPGESLEAPRFTIYDNTVNYFFPDGDLLRSINSHLGIPNNNDASPGWSTLVANRDRAENLVTVAVDISGDLAPYNGISATVEIADGTGCAYNWVEGSGYALVAVRNLGATTANTYDVTLECSTINATRLQVQTVTPSSFTLTIGPGSISQTVPGATLSLVNGTVPGHDPPVVYCETKLFDQNNVQLALATKAFACIRIPDSSESWQDLSNDTSIMRDGACERDPDTNQVHCEDNSGSDVNWGLVLVAFVGGLAVITIGAIAVIACFCLCCKPSKSSTGAAS